MYGLNEKLSANGYKPKARNGQSSVKPSALPPLHRRSERFELRGLGACLVECKHLAE